MKKDVCWIVFFIIIIFVFYIKSISIQKTFKNISQLHDASEQLLETINIDELENVTSKHHETMIFHADSSKIYLDTFESMKSKTGKKPTAQQLQFLKVMKQDITKSSTVELYDKIRVVTITKVENHDYCVLKYIFV